MTFNFRKQWTHLLILRTSMKSRLIPISVWVVAAVILAGSLGETAAQPKKIVLLHSYGPNFEPWGTSSRVIRNELNRVSPWTLDLQEHSLLLALGGNEAAEARFVEYLKAFYAQQAPDLIFVLGGPAARFVQQHRADLFPTVPTLLTSVEIRRVEQSILTERDAMVGVQADLVAAFENILKLLPETKSIAVIIGNSPRERFWIDELQRELKPLLQNKVDLIFYNEQPFEEILKNVASLPAHSAIFFQQLMVDGTGAVYGDRDPLKRIHEVASAPIFSYEGAYFADEIVGGPMLLPAERARRAAAVAIRLLGGEEPGSIKVSPIEFSTPKYDWRQLRRWNIGEERLPPGSEILFRQASIWETYRWQFFGITATLLLQSLLIGVLLYEDRRRRFAEREAKQRLSELAHVSRLATVGELSASITHELKQPLTSIRANAQALQLMLKNTLPDIGEIRAIANDIERDDVRASEVIDHLRALLQKKPPDQQPEDLNEIVREAITLLSSQIDAAKVKTRIAVSYSSLAITADKVQIQQVIINLIVNAIEAMSDIPPSDRQLIIWTARHDGSAEVNVADTGPGIHVDRLKEVFQPFVTTKSSGMGVGLSIARTLIEAHHGTITADNRIDGGAVFRVRLPLRKLVLA